MTLKSSYYDHFVADRYDKQLEDITQAFRQICIDRVKPKEGDTVLDLGCGTGLNQPYIAAKIGPSGKIVGVDASEKMLSHAKERAAKHGYADRLHLIQGDLRELDRLVDTSFDAVVATLIFSVVPDWRDVFDKSFAKLKPGGRYGVMDNY